MAFGKYTREEAIAKLKERQKRARKPKKVLKSVLKRKERLAIKLAKKREKKYFKSLPNKLTEVCHTKIKERDSVEGEKKKGYCCCCGKLVEGALFQAGHYRSKGSVGILLKWHPWNIHGQCRDCNMVIRQDAVKPNYAEFMRKRYTPEQLDKMTEIKNSTSLKIKADKYFFESMIDLYKQGDENEIVKFLEGFI